MTNQEELIRAINFAKELTQDSLGKAAIEAAEKCLIDPSEENRLLASHAAQATRAAWVAADAAACASYIACRYCMAHKRQKQETLAEVIARVKKRLKEIDSMEIAVLLIQAITAAQQCHQDEQGKAAIEIASLCLHYPTIENRDLAKEALAVYTPAFVDAIKVYGTEDQCDNDVSVMHANSALLTAVRLCERIASEKDCL